MGNFYKIVRRKLNILVDKNGEPKGKKWSFDEENRKKLPKEVKIPSTPKFLDFVMEWSGKINSWAWVKHLKYIEKKRFERNYGKRKR